MPSEWFLLVRDGTCPECGLAPSSVATASIGAALVEEAHRWAQMLLSNADSPSLAMQPAVGVWSALEYGGHARDTLTLFEERIRLALAAENQHFEYQDQDAEVRDGRYDEADPAILAGQLVANAERFKRLLGDIPRSGLATDGQPARRRTFRRRVAGPLCLARGPPSPSRCGAFRLSITAHSPQPGERTARGTNLPAMSPSSASTALVTGATRGIGKQVALGLARRGYDVAFTGRTQHEGDAARRPEAEGLPELKLVSGSLDATAAAIEALGQRAFPLAVDLLDRNQVLACGPAALDALGHIDVLCNNAIYVGPAGERLFLDTPADEIEKRLYGNVAAQLLLMQPIVRHMVEQGGGVVGNVTSGAGYAKPPARIGEGGWALTYGVSKAGFHRIVSQVLAEHERDGLRAYNLQPGAVATERVMAAGEKLEFVRRHAAPVEVVGDTIAHILTAPPGEFTNGGNLQVQDIARDMGTLPA